MNTDARDTPNVGSAVAVALVCFALGAAFVFTLRHDDSAIAADVSEPRTPTKPPTKSPSTTSAETAATPHDGPASAPPAHEVASAPSELAPSEPVPSEPAPTPGRAAHDEEPEDSQATAELQLIPGRVAYLRCDGLRADKGPFPCPRDVTLETEAWAALGALPRCRPSLERGGVDVRLDLVRGKPTDVRVLPIAGSPEPPLDAERVYACVGKSLAKLNTRLDPIYMVVSMRASLR